MKNWKTTLGGVLGSLSIPLIAASDIRLHIAGIALAMAASTWFGYHAADK